jgi:hypothetical protein
MAILGAVSVDVRPLHQRRQWQAVLVDIERLDVGRGSRLLIAELVAGEEQDDEAGVWRAEGGWESVEGESGGKGRRFCFLV